jgi:hypothetical protein
MRDILRESNEDLLREIEKLREILRDAGKSISVELDMYFNWAVSTCDEFHRSVGQILSDVNLQQDTILPDLLSSTQVVTQEFHLFNQRLVTPILRARSSDRLCLKLLQWLHSIHPKTQGIPAGIADGEFAVWPTPSLPTIYFMPCSAQYGFLYLPLFLHEFGHLLYIRHKPEMDDLVRSLQEAIAELLEPSTRRDDRHAYIETEKRSAVVETWYEWAQELFCDAVGFVIGGPAFPHALSMYLRMLGRGEYHLRSDHLERRAHPVTWLRVQILADRLRRAGFNADASMLENAWSLIGKTMGVVEDYYGFFVSEFLPAIQQTIDDMLTEAGPRKFTDQEISSSKIELPSSSPVHLLNQARQRFLEDRNGYRSWEEKAIATFLAT